MELKLEYSGPGIENNIEPGALAAIRKTLYHPKEFKDLIINCLAKNCKVVVFAAIQYPHFIPIVLEPVIGFTKEQLSNIGIVYNGEDANAACQPYKHIKLAEELMGLQKDQRGNGLVISSSLGNPITDLSSNIDYILCRMDLEKSGNASSACSLWSRISAFEEQRYALMQKAKADEWTLEKLQNEIWDKVKKHLRPYTRLKYWVNLSIG
ncbi:MAG: hypothetical protein NMK33_00395 [Candidatus Cardinium sp.]|uniref:hypothetical protein n=1 Tax=Cardinium endosymbiont of Dermatophagoides farinae TaxID=2597823 RepID=UPI0011827983|nr:hypothetical protein [Cardinium endosymbiont of Dermatophagoides farinae]TSJ80991.1 hypothetical protein FPG78_03075 [Cardinium endosymbiont of Dermatophagoides farinae]UWW97017.1 MAG: hypothetical protein NMK33_00395 [Candidatus Cardinium sp.]